MRANRSRKHRIEVAMNDQEYEEFMKHIEECGLSNNLIYYSLLKIEFLNPCPPMIFKKSFVN
mgnify:CR=1 FL=1